jgi:hypothetical protein
MRLSPVPIGIGMGVCGGACYRELPRISLLETVWKFYARANLLTISRAIAA